MAARPRREGLALKAGLVVILLAALAHFWAARPVVLHGLLLDESLTITEGSDIAPSAPIGVGDRVVGIDGVRIDEPARLVMALLASDGDVGARVRRETLRQSYLLTPERLEDDPPQGLAESTIISADGRAIGTPVALDELLQWTEEAAPEPIHLEVETTGSAVDGTISVEREPAPLAGLIVFGLGLLGAATLLVFRRDYLDERGAALWIDVAALISGAMGMAGVLTLVESTFVSPRYVLWALAAIALWRGLSALLHASTVGLEVGINARSVWTLAPAALTAFAGVGLLLTSVGRVPNPSWVTSYADFLLATIMLVAGYHVAEVVGYYRDQRALPRGSWFGAVVGLAVAVGTLVLLGVDSTLMTTETYAMSLTALVAVQWLGDMLGLVPEGRLARREQDREGVGLLDYLDKIGRATTDGDVAIVAGIDGAFARIVAEEPAADGERLLMSWPATETLSAMLSMLATEGGMYPRHAAQHGVDAVEDDPFEVSAQRLDIAAAIPVHAEAGGVAAFVVVTGASPAELDLEILAASIGDGLNDVASAEVAAIVAAELLKAMRKRAAQADRPARPAMEGPAVDEQSTPPALHTPDPALRAWAEFLKRADARPYPVDDPDSLNAAEWRALEPLALVSDPVLIVGEPGVGKTFLARALHSRSARADDRIAVLDCATTPWAVIQLELFGDGEETGITELVQGGTLVLKGVGTLAPPTVETLVERLTATEATIVFTERYAGPEGGLPTPIHDAIKRAVGDRYLHVTPLRDRKKDIRRYARYFLHQASMRYGRLITDFDDEAIAWLTEQPLPGNFYELDALVRRAVLHSPVDAQRVSADNMRTRELPPQEVPEILDPLLDVIPDPIREQFDFHADDDLLGPEDAEDAPAARRVAADETIVTHGNPFAFEQGIAANKHRSSAPPSASAEPPKPKPERVSRKAADLEDLSATLTEGTGIDPEPLDDDQPEGDRDPATAEAAPAAPEPSAAQGPEDAASAEAPPKAPAPQDTPADPDPDAELRASIEDTLARNDGNKSATARELGWSRGKLLRTLTKLGIDG